MRGRTVSGGHWNRKVGGGGYSHGQSVTMTPKHVFLDILSKFSLDAVVDPAYGRCAGGNEVNITAPFCVLPKSKKKNKYRNINIQ